MPDTRDKGRLEIRAPSHVHAGNPDISGDYGRLYGTLGFTLEDPNLTLEAALGAGGPGGCLGCPRDAVELYESYAEEYGCRPLIRVAREIPRHVGLGSTTPLYISIALVFDRLCGSGRGSPLEYARETGRGRISGLGVYSYIHGGMLFDAGFEPGSDEIPPLLFHAIPPAWIRVLVVLPSRPIGEILELKEREDEILASMPRMDSRVADKASRLLLMGVLGNAAAGKWVEALHYTGVFNRLLGEYWASRQGSIYCCSEVEELVETLEGLGAIGVAQSSWGPTVYAFFDSRRADLALVERRVRERLEGLGGGRVWLTRVAEKGARVRIQ